jgi:hypothetical protein
MRLFALAPQTTGANSEAVSAEPGGGGAPIIISLSPSYSFSGNENAAEIESMLRARDAELRELVLDVIEDAGIDTARKTYR